MPVNLRNVRWPSSARPGAVAAVLFVALIAALLLFAPNGSDLESPAAPRVSERSATMLRLSWQPVARSDFYRVAVTTDGWRSETVTERKIEGTEAQIAHLDPDTKYQIRITAVDAHSADDEDESDPSDAVEARTAARSRPSLLRPTAPTVIEARNTSLTIGWEPVRTARWYEVQIAGNPRFEGARSLRSKTRFAGIINLDAATQYHVRVRAVRDDGRAASRWAPALTAATIRPSDPLPLAVASYNIKCHSCGGPSWRSRRSGVAATIASRGLDVVGLQEAQQSGGPQFDQLIEQLDKVQPGWKLTNREVRGTLGVRIIYNASRIRLLQEGGAKYEHQGNDGKNHQRFYVWAHFLQRSSGKQFLFFNTHLDPDSRDARIEQAGELAKEAAKARGKLPVIVVGDMNASQYQAYAVHEELQSAGLVDPLGIQQSSHDIGPQATAERRIHTNYDSFNDFAKKPRVSVGEGHNGTYLDYIFTSPMRVIEFENVVNLDSDGNYRRAASDHNLIRAIVGLP